MICLHCGSCCRELSPISNPEPCPHITIDRAGYAWCGIYGERPQPCRDHDYNAVVCPIGLAWCRRMGIAPEDAAKAVSGGGRIMKFVKDGHTIEEWINAVVNDTNHIMETDDYRPVAIRVYLVSKSFGGSSATLVSDNEVFDEYFGDDDGAGRR